MKRFIDQLVSRTHRYSLGRDSQTGEAYLSIPVANRMIDYEEYYQLEPTLYDRFFQDEDAASRFADECRWREHDNLLILQPGTDRGTAV